jgi:hypothetical protein
VTLKASGSFIKPQKLKTMKMKQMPLTHVQGRLSRAEMKNVMAGDETVGGQGSCTVKCENDAYTCTSDKGDCLTDRAHFTICCDGITYNCKS